jgi:hypothetical protein
VTSIGKRREDGINPAIWSNKNLEIFSLANQNLLFEYLVISREFKPRAALYASIRPIKKNVF